MEDVREREGERERGLVEGEGLGLSKRGVWGVGGRREVEGGKTFVKESGGPPPPLGGWGTPALTLVRPYPILNLETKNPPAGAGGFLKERAI